MAIIRRLVSPIAKRRARTIEKMLRNPVEVMDKVLAEVLKRNSDSLYGKKFGFANVVTPEDYSRIVPLTDYEKMTPYLEHVYANPSGRILTEDPVFWYYQTSGSSGAPKQLPVTKPGMQQIAEGGASMWMTYMSADSDNARILDGTMIMFGAAAILNQINGVNVGYASGVGVLHVNPLFKRLIKPGIDVFNIHDMDEKMRTYALLTAKEDVTALQGITTLCLAFVRRMQDQYGPWLEQELAGTKHAVRLSRAMYDDGKIDVAELWPNMRLWVVSGIDTEPYRQWVTKTFPDAWICEVYASSEGFYGSQFYAEPGIRIFPNLNYLEFIPEREVEKENPEVIPLSEVKKGHRYELVVTNMNGWYRYRLGDLLTFIDTNPYTVTNIGRKGKVVNLSGEKVSEAHVIKAIAGATKKTSAEIMDYTVVGHVKEGVPSYTIAAMFRNNPPDPIEFVSAFEDTMKSINEEFRVVREMGAIGPTTLVLMQTSHFEDIVSQTHLQAKPMSLTTDESVLATT